MKVRITVTVDIDPKRWNGEYSACDKPSDIRRSTKADVQQAVENQYAHFRFEDGGYFAGVEVK